MREQRSLGHSRQSTRRQAVVLLRRMTRGEVNGQALSPALIIYHSLFTIYQARYNPMLRT